MDKDIEDLKRRAGITEAEHLTHQDEQDLYSGYQGEYPNVLTDKDKKTVASRVITLLKRHREWRALTSALTQMVMSEMERMYDQGYQDAQNKAMNLEGEGQSADQEHIDRIRKAHNIPSDVPD